MMDYDWLRKMADRWDVAVTGGHGWPDIGAVGGFINYLERTGATPCDDCECMKAFVLQELRRGNFTEGPPPKDVV